MRRFQRLLFVQIATEAGFKNQSFPIESHINMPSFIALKSMFTAWYKELFQPLWIVSPFIIILNEIHLDTKVWGVAALIARWPEIGSWSWFKSASDQTLSTTLSHYTGSLLCLCCRCLLEQVLTHNLRLCPFSCQWIQSNYDHVNKTKHICQTGDYYCKPTTSFISLQLLLLLSSFVSSLKYLFHFLSTLY